MDAPVPFHVDPRSATPIYDQIVTQVKHAVAAGTLDTGQALPSVRQLAVSLRINPNTVARAYRDLEGEGVVQTRRGLGTFVAESGPRLTPAARRRALQPAVEKLAADGRTLALTLDDVIALLRSAWQRFEDKP